jgi:hypothetical protein
VDVREAYSIMAGRGKATTGALPRQVGAMAENDFGFYGEAGRTSAVRFVVIRAATLGTGTVAGVLARYKLLLNNKI